MWREYIGWSGESGVLEGIAPFWLQLLPPTNQAYAQQFYTLF